MFSRTCWIYPPPYLVVLYKFSALFSVFAAISYPELFSTEENISVFSRSKIAQVRNVDFGNWRDMLMEKWKRSCLNFL